MVGKGGLLRFEELYDVECQAYKETIGNILSFFLSKISQTGLISLSNNPKNTYWSCIKLQSFFLLHIYLQLTLYREPDNRQNQLRTSFCFVASQIEVFKVLLSDAEIPLIHWSTDQQQNNIY